jgi:hypothetical protein
MIVAAQPRNRYEPLADPPAVMRTWQEAARVLREGLKADRFTNRWVTGLRETGAQLAGRTGEQLMSVVDPATLGPADFVHWCDGKMEGAVGTLHDAPVMLFGPMNNAFPLQNAYPGFDGPQFTPPLANTTTVELQGGPRHSFRLEFPAGIKDPVLHLASLASALSFTDGSAVTLITVTLVSGDQHFEVNGSTVSGQLAGSSDSNGTVVIPGVFQQFTFTLTPTFSATATEGVFLQLGGTRPS